MRPDVAHLTDFYLCMSIGGVVGGLFCALIAPAVFDALYELPILVVAAALLMPAPVDAPVLSAFQRRYPSSGYSTAALYWLANAQYGKRDYKDAIPSFRALVAAAPDHPRAPEALLSIANCQLELKDTKSARRTLDELLKNYPKSEAAQAGRERLASLK